MSDIKIRDGIELGYGVTIFDIPEEKGIELIVPIGSESSNMYAKIFFLDEQAKELIDIIQNKLNGRL